jgi:hypothetical protein
MQVVLLAVLVRITSNKGIILDYLIKNVKGNGLDLLYQNLIGRS